MEHEGGEEVLAEVIHADRRGAAAVPDEPLVVEVGGAVIPHLRRVRSYYRFRNTVTERVSEHGTK